GTRRDLASFPTRRSSDLDAGEVRCEIEGATAVGERGDVDVVELEYIGQGLTRRRRQQQAAVLRRGEHGVMLQHLQPRVPGAVGGDRKSTRLNSSHDQISY